MHDTLLSDLDGSIYWYYIFYLVSNAVLLISSAVVIVLPLVTSGGFLDKKWGIVSAAFGALLAYLGLGGVSTNFIKARNDLQVAKYHYYSDNDREKLIAAYERAKGIAVFVPSVPPTTDKGPQPPKSSTAQPITKSP